MTLSMIAELTQESHVEIPVFIIFNILHIPHLLPVLPFLSVIYGIFSSLCEIIERTGKQMQHAVYVGVLGL